MFFKKKESSDQDIYFTKIASLLIHAAKIDENFSSEEEKIIKESLIELGVKEENLDKIFKNAEIYEEDSNQILDFTKEVKNLSEKEKIKIIETLWKIIYSNNVADMFEDNLMRRLAGLLYIDNKIMGTIKDRIKKEKLK
tara:strand:- start:381 stop:797 length:417 start_codon:yes stop_codon:yes gene_type:complete